MREVLAAIAGTVVGSKWILLASTRLTVTVTSLPLATFVIVSTSPLRILPGWLTSANVVEPASRLLVRDET